MQEIYNKLNYYLNEICKYLEKHDTFLLYLFAAPKSSIFCKFCQQNHKKNHPFSRVAYFYLRLLRFAFASLPPHAIPIPVPIRPKTKKSQAPTAGMQL